MNKKGAGHIEFILSFILFVGVVTFAIFFFNPAADSKVVGSTLPFVFSEFKKNVNVEMDMFSIVINKDLAKGEVISVEIKEVDLEKNIRVEDYKGSVLNSVRAGDIVSFNFNKEDFVFVKFSEAFTSPVPPSKTAPEKESYYEIASSSSRELISEEKVMELKELYESDYEASKERFNLPPGLDFSFVLAFSNEDFISAQRDIPAGVEIFSKIRREEVLREEGGLAFADLSIAIW
jgi:hypothetical protein